MIYEKPELSFQKFHTETFLDELDVLSANDPDDDFDVWDEGFDFNSFGFNGTFSIDPDGVGGWLNG